MSDLLRMVTLDVGGRPVVVKDLNDMATFASVRGSFAFNAPAKQQVMASAGRRYGGSWQVGETHDNASYSWSALVAGGSADAAIAAVEQLLAVLEDAPAGNLFVEWRPDGATYATLREVRGTSAWTCRYEWVMFAGARCWIFDVQIPVEPLARGLPMSIYDPFDVDTRGDSTYDAGTSADEQVASGILGGVGTLTTERRAIHTARGYLYVDSRQQCKVTPGATITGFKVGRVIKCLDVANYIEGYVDDDGTNSRVRIDKIIAGVRTNIATTNLGSRVVAGTPLWVRTTMLGRVITAEHFTAAPGPLTAPTTTCTVTIGTSTATLFGTGVAGGFGRVWIPMHASASLDDEYATPFFSGSQTLPQVMQFGTPIPGDAPALCDATVTHSGGGSPPIWALLGWTRRPGTGLAAAPFGILEAETASNLSGWSVVGSDATARGSSLLKDTAAASTDVYTASWELDPSLLVADSFDREIAIEVWARVLLSSTLVSPSLKLSLRPEDGLTFGAARWTEEWGSTGRLLTVPSSGASLYRITRLGTLRMLVDSLRPRKWLLWLDGAVGVGSSGNFGIDYLAPVPARQRACSPSGVPDDAGYPDFLSTVSQVSKTIRSDLSALVASPPKWGHPDHGLGGQLLELPPGNLDMFCKLSSLVPDDPTATANIEQLAHTGCVELSITPRWNVGRT